jgi:asparagine synthase (glutamine-hydrolysing)
VSGLCGWIGHGLTTTENRQLAEQMVRPLVRFDDSNVQILVGGNSALAVAANSESAHIYQNKKLMAAIWGRVKFSDSNLAQLSHTDGMAKTLANSWLENGEKVFSDLTGTFVLCILDESSGKTILATDRMGTQPLSYQISGQGIVFGSSADAIIANPLAKSEIDPQSLYNYVYFHMIPSPGTIYQGQKRLLPGEFLVHEQGTVRSGKYWEINFLESKQRPFEELKQDFLEGLRSSVKRAAGDEEVGAFLSGGTDSSTIAGILSEINGRPARTYSIGFEAAGYDEMEYARIAAQHFSTEHHEYYVTPDDIVEAIPQIAAIFDQPFGNSSAIPTFYCARKAKSDGITRLLGGDGGDELFGGNVRYAKQYIFSFYDHLPPILRNQIIEPIVFGIPNCANLPIISKARSYIEQAKIPMPARTETYNLLGRYGHEAVFTNEFLDTVNSRQPIELINNTYNQTHAQSLINRMLSLDLKFTLADNDLPKVVKSCELAGVDVSFPFLDDQIVAYSAQLEPNLKLRRTKLRYFFKEALRDFLPNEIITKQKHGFGLPFGVWLQDHKPLKALAADSLSDLKSRNIIRTDFINKLLKQHLNEHAGYHGTMVWVLMMLEQWYKQRNINS